MYAIEVKNVTKVYRKGLRGIKVPAVTDLSFNVQKERITGFVGPNGAGKTTTIKMITGLVQPTAGKLVLSGGDAAQPSVRTGIAYLSEQPYFYAHLTVAEMLRFVAHLIRIPSASVTREIARVLDIVELPHKAKAKVRELSKGMQQRLNMAQALLGSPHTLILDEPMSGMDPPGRRLFREILRTLRSEKKTLFFSTHVLDDIESICDDVVVVQQGNLTYEGAVSSLLSEGFLGTEIITAPIPQELHHEIVHCACTVQNDTVTNKSLIFLDKGGDLESLLKMLAGNSVYPTQVTRKTMTLEALLYRRTTGSAS